jgi:SAM-dependent methyltransferase
MTTAANSKPPGPLLIDESALPITHLSIEQLQAKIQKETQALPLLAGLRDFNQTNLEALLQQYPGTRETARMLDVGASIHGFALASADQLGCQEYVGIDLDVTRHWGAPLVHVTSGGNRRHLLCQMDAHRLWLPDESVDLVACLSGFEHYLFPELVLSEIMRVLRKGGVALINYEPIWTCSYGHHLHHFGLGYDQVPPWSHLILTMSQMGALLAEKTWPAGCNITRSQALEWIYTGRDINRRDVKLHEQLLRSINCAQMLWCLPHADPSPVAQAAADYAASLLPYSRDQLLTRGFSCCFRK